MEAWSKSMSTWPSKSKYSVKAIQRQTVVGRGDRLECRDTHLGSEIPSQMPNVVSASLSLLRQGLRLDRFR